MKKLLLISLLFSVAAQAQIIASGGLLGDTGATSASKTYVSIPSCPTFTSPQLLVSATTGTTITSGEATDSELIIDADPAYAFIQWNAITSEKHIQSESQSDDSDTWSIVGTTGTGGSMTTVNNTSNLNFYCLKISNRSQGFGTIDPHTTGPNFSLENVIIYNNNAAGIQANTDVEGEFYGVFSINYCMFRDQGDEKIYLGGTTPGPNQTTFDTLNFSHNYSDSSEWDIDQFTGVLWVNATNNTGRHGGIAGDVGQDRLLQVQNSRGVYENFILDSAGNWINVASNSFRFHNGFFAYYRNTFATQVDMSDNNLSDTAVLTATSTDTEAIPTSHPTNVTFTLAESSRGYFPGELLMIQNTTSNWFYGTVVSYSGDDLTISSEYNNGTGSFSSWTVSGLVLYDSLTIYDPNNTANYYLQVNEDACSIVANHCEIKSGKTFFDDNRGSSTYVLAEVNTTYYATTPNLPEYGNHPTAGSDRHQWIQVIVDDYWYGRGCGAYTTD